ncbi:MAG: hypothetical protein JXN60_04000 [Lentisphaerae bacterium]|nr:hypothetical protein [Lentisphaerota bacterium]
MKLNKSWPVLRTYDSEHIAKIALPLGGIGTGTVSLGGRGDLRDWEMVNRPAKGFTPKAGRNGQPIFTLFAKPAGGKSVTRAIEGPLDVSAYEGPAGCQAANHGMPRFRHCSFAAAYPFGQVLLKDSDVPVEVRIEAFNPMIPGDADASGIPMAVLRFVLKNRTRSQVAAAVCGSLANFIGIDGSESARDFRGRSMPFGARRNRNHFRRGRGIQGIFMDSEGVDPKAEAWGTLALVTNARSKVTYTREWSSEAWGGSVLGFWDQFSKDGCLTDRYADGTDISMGSLSVSVRIPPGQEKTVSFFLTWHFPNRYSWTWKNKEKSPNDWIGNYYTTKFKDAWDVAEQAVTRIPKLEKDTQEFVSAFCSSDIPAVVKEAALFNLSTLRSQTCFRTPDGRFYGWEGCWDHIGSCHGSCTHVWNYEQATAFLYGNLAGTMREVEFKHATDEKGMMSFRVNLPLKRARQYGKAAADGQLGCIMKLYRDWQLSGNDAMLTDLWPKARKALEFCWIDGGWDGDKDGVMEGCQHNTMDVEYYGPNPQMQGWYLGALRAAEEMAAYVGQNEFALQCRDLYESGKIYMEKTLFNGEYYKHIIRPPAKTSDVADCLKLGMGSKNLTKPDFQLGEGCLVDQLVGQYMAHVCGLGYLVSPLQVRKTLKSILKYNKRASMHDHFNCMRTFALADESALLMAAYPKRRPKQPFPYFTEVMTGFEYTAAIGMFYEGMVGEGQSCISDIRARYDGRKRNPFNEAECGHHYARAMASWAAIPALTGFRYSGVDKLMEFACSAQESKAFWSNGFAWGICSQKRSGKSVYVTLTCLHGAIKLKAFALTGYGYLEFGRMHTVKRGECIQMVVTPNDPAVKHYLA